MSLDYNREANSNLGISLCHTHFGRLYENEQKWDKALDEYRQAYVLMADGVDQWHWLESCIALGRVSIKMGNLAAAREYADKAVATAHKIHSFEHLSDAYELYYLYYERQGDGHKALANYVESRRYADSLAIEKTASHMQNVRVRYERDSHQKEVGLLQSNYESEHSLRVTTVVAVSVIILLLLLLVGALWWVNRTRAAKNRLMKQLETTRTNFFTNVTHEFRTPITVIMGLSESIADGKIEGEELQKAARVISKQGNGLLNLVNQLLDISKVKSETGALEWRRGNVVSYMHMVAESCTQYAKRQGITLVFSPVENTIVMDFIPDYIHKVMHNLISNSLKFTPKGGHIYISTNVSHTELILRVADNGQGIDATDLPHIFEPFYQGADSNTALGTGIGLSLVSQMIKAMDGTISVKSSLGKGAVFTIKLPLKHAEEVLPLEEKNAELGMQNAEWDGAEDNNSAFCIPNSALTSKPIVLIVEDNDSVAYYISSHISDRYQVHYAHDGRDGLQKAIELVPDVIVTDLMMPEMDGIAMCQHIRRNEILSHIPVIMVTAKADDHDKVLGLKAGADAYLVKPFNLHELIVRIDKLIEQRRLLCEKYQRALQAGNVETDDMNTEDRQFISRFVNIIYSLMTKSASTDLETVAAALNMTSRTLSRKVMAITGDSPLLYINKIKVAKAKTLMDADAEITISEVAYKCGFEDPNYFSRIFKQVEGVTPTAYRRRVK